MTKQRKMAAHFGPPRMRITVLGSPVRFTLRNGNGKAYQFAVPMPLGMWHHLSVFTTRAGRPRVAIRRLHRSEM